MALKDIAVIENTATHCKVLTLTETGDRVVNKAITPLNDYPYGEFSEHKRYTLMRNPRAELIKLLGDTDIVVDGDLTKPYHYQHEMDKMAMELELSLIHI